MSVDHALLVLAFVCFLLKAVGIDGRVNLTALGLAAWVGSLIL